MKSVYINDLTSGMHLAKPIYSMTGKLLLENGTILNEGKINKIKKTGISAIFIYDDELVTTHDKRETVKIMHKHFTDYMTNGNFSKRKGLIPYNSYEKIKEIVSSIFDLIKNNENMLVSINNVMEKDFYTYEHSLNVCILSILISLEMDLEKNIILQIGLGALLHDIGKIAVTDAILNKKGKLTKREMKLIKKHSELGYDFVKDSNELSQITKDIILYHHERVNGSGYPSGKSTKELENGRYINIVSLIDVFDAMTNDRIYKKKMPVYKALEFVSSQVPESLDYRVFKILKSIIVPFPVGTIVRLTTGEVGVVIKNFYNRPTRPTIKVIFDNNKNKIKEDFQIDLMKNLTTFIHDRCELDE